MSTQSSDQERPGAAPGSSEPEAKRGPSRPALIDDRFSVPWALPDEDDTSPGG